MPIQHGSKKVKEVYHGSKKVKEVYQGSKKVYSSDKTVPPYAMLHVIDKQSPLQRTYVNTSAEMVEKSGSIGSPVKTRKGVIQCLMADGQSLVFKNDSISSRISLATAPTLGLSSLGRLPMPRSNFVISPFFPKY